MIIKALFAISSYLALFYAFVIFIKKKKHISDFYLVLWLLVLSAYMISLGFFPEYDWICGLYNAIFLFLYIKSHTSKPSSDIRDLLYFIPSILFMVAVFLSPGYASTNVFNIAKSIIQISFVVASFLQLRKYKRKIKDCYADLEYADMNWLYLLFYGNLFFFLLHIFAHFFGIIPGKEIAAVTLFLFMNITGVIAIRRKVTFIKRLATNEKKSDSKTYSNYGLKDADADSLAQKLQLYMETERPYVNQELCLNDLSKALDIYPHYITQVLNTVFKQNFYDYINSYRIEEVKKQLKDPKKDHITVLAIAFDCGFNSKTTFNRSFKQKTNQTPSAYRSSKISAV